MELTASGDLMLHTPTGQLRQRRPSAFQELAGRRTPVEVEYELAGNRNIGLRIGAYDSAAPLVIDPAVVYTSTLLQQGTIYDLATDTAGDVYMTGLVASGRGVCGLSSFFGRTYIIPCNDAFVAKLDPTGTQVLYYTVLGGISEDHAVSITADSAGNAYVLGNTYSTDFPVSANAAQTKFAGPTGPILLDLTGGDLFIAKLDPFGRLLYSTFLGGPGNDVAGRIRIDLAGNAYVSGFSYSSDFPTTAGVYLSGRAIGGPVVAKINPAGTQLVWATYLHLNFGRSGLDVDAAGAVYVASGPAVVKLGADGGSLLYRTTFGQKLDVTYDLAADSQGAPG
jgi:hypothetical protein